MLAFKPSSMWAGEQAAAAAASEREAARLKAELDAARAALQLTHSRQQHTDADHAHVRSLQEALAGAPPGTLTSSRGVLTI
jgi:hypothetical protein